MNNNDLFEEAILYAVSIYGRNPPSGMMLENYTNTVFKKYSELVAQQSVQGTNAPARNYIYTPGIGHYKNCPVCVGECVCP